MQPAVELLPELVHLRGVQDDKLTHDPHHEMIAVIVLHHHRRLVGAIFLVEVRDPFHESPSPLFARAIVLLRSGARPRVMLSCVWWALIAFSASSATSRALISSPASFSLSWMPSSTQPRICSIRGVIASHPPWRPS